MKLKFYRAAILNPISDKECQYLPDGLLVLAWHQTKKSWFIKEIIQWTKGEKKYHRYFDKKHLFELEESVIMPSFFDMHFHWVQDDVRLMPKDSLLEWLEKYTFPTEMKFADKQYATERAKYFFDYLLQTGTLGGACYSSIHAHALEAAMKYAQGDFVIGNVLMNMHSPEELTQTEAESLKLTEKLTSKFKSRYAFTPRFAITTTPKVMKEGAKMADKNKCFKQTHLSETKAEISFVMSIYKKLKGFEKVKSYTEIYEKTGMLGARSLMGHGIHLGTKELSTLHKTKTAIVHCPTSNAPHEDLGLGSGLFDFKKVEGAKVRWALGSDIGGGPYLSMFDVMRSFVAQNKLKKRSGATYIKALFRSTLAGAHLLGLGKTKGNLEVGKEANFIVVPFPTEQAPKNAEQVLKSIIEPLSSTRSGYDLLVTHTFLQGDCVYQKGRNK